MTFPALRILYHPTRFSEAFHLIAFLCDCVLPDMVKTSDMLDDLDELSVINDLARVLPDEYFIVSRWVLLCAWKQEYILWLAHAPRNYSVA